MINILVFMNSFNLGGVTSLMQDIYDHLDRNKYRMSFVRPNWNINEFDAEVSKNGDNVFYYENADLGKMPVLNYALRRKVMVDRVCSAVGKSPKYDVAYIHANSSYCVPAAKKMGIQKIIMHSHEGVSDFNGNEKRSTIMKMIWDYRVKMYNRLVDYKVGDSEKACVAKFGECVRNDPKMMVLHPPINRDKYNLEKYDSGKATKTFQVNPEALNLVHVGRLCPVKNQPFLIDVLTEICNTQTAELFIVGNGDTEKEKLIHRAKEKNVLPFVHFLPGNTDIPLLLTAMDCSLLPSFSEAFGMVAVESQLMNVPCIASENVPMDVDIGLCSFVPLSEGAEGWSKAILETKNTKKEFDPNRADEFSIDFIMKKLVSIF